ncbi:MAG: VWA domain-containing protein [Bacteroidota bacterium]
MRALYLPLLLVLLSLTSCFQFRTVSDRGRTTSPPPQYGPNKIQIALILDTSGSMDDLLEHAKTEFWYVVEELMYQYDGQRPPQLEIALYEYGNKRIGKGRDYVRQVVPLTTELDWIADELWQLDSRGRKEYVGLAIERATRELNWSRNPQDIKMIFVAGNESFQRGPVNPYRAIDQACGRDIEVHTLFAGSFNDGIAMGWREGANSCGTYAAMDFAQPYNPYNTVYDRQICDLNVYYNQTFLPYGAYGATYYDRCIRQDQYFQSYGYSWYSVRTYVKTGPFYFNPRWDLVDAIGCGQVRLEDLPRNQWPRDMRGMSIRQANDYVADKRREREELNRKIKALHAQRRGVIRQANPSRQSTRAEFGSFNAAVAGTIRPAGTGTQSGRREITRTPSNSGPRTSASQTRPSRTTPSRTSPSRTSPAETRPSRTTPTRTSPSRTSPAETRPSRTTPTRTSPSRTSPTETRPSRTTPTRTSPSRTSPAETRPSRTTPTRTSPSVDRQAEQRRAAQLQQERRAAQVQQERREAEARRQAEERRAAQVQQERREAEARRQAEERRAAQVQQERREAEARRQAEERRAAQAQQERREAEARRQAEERRAAQVQQERREAEARRQAEERRAAQAQQERREAEARRQAEQRRTAQAQQERREAEARRQAEQRRAAQAQQERREAQARQKAQQEQQRRAAESRRSSSSSSSSRVIKR